ncbi:MAG: hypothetical protein L0323_22800, partial [Planctomycetes bacterium]|nr:hypothetical protein [Planctomycetota bacterium]
MNESLIRRTADLEKRVRRYQNSAAREGALLRKIAEFVPADLETDGKVVEGEEYDYGKSRNPLAGPEDETYYVRLFLTAEEAERVRGCGLSRHWTKKLDAGDGNPHTSYTAEVLVGTDPVNPEVRLVARVILYVAGLPESCALITEEVETPAMTIPAGKKKVFRVQCGPAPEVKPPAELEVVAVEESTVKASDVTAAKA